MDLGRFLSSWKEQPIEPFDKLLDGVWSMTSPRVGAMLNFAVSCLEENEVYLEVGVLHGATMSCALYGNQVQAWAVDNWEMFESTEGNPIAFHNRMDRLGLSDYVILFEEDYRAFLRNPPDGNVGMYFYDGPHTYGHTYDALELAVPLYSSPCLIIVDDYNWDFISRAVSDWQHHHSDKAQCLYRIRTLPDDKTWWNGIAILAWN